MARGVADFKCPGCEFATKQTVGRPTAMRHTVVVFKCKNCDSGITAMVERDREQPNRVKISTRISKPGKRFLEALHERLRIEAEAKKAKRTEVRAKERAEMFGTEPAPELPVGTVPLVEAQEDDKKIVMDTAVNMARAALSHEVGP